MGAGIQAHAQFMGSFDNEYEKKTAKKSEKRAASETPERPGHFGSIWFSYFPMTLTYSEKSMTRTDLYHGAGLTWTNANALGNTSLYIEYGLGAQYAYGKQSGNEAYSSYTSTNHLLFLNIPLQLLYRFQFPSTKIAISPYTGLLLEVPIFWMQDTKTITNTGRTPKTNYTGSSYYFYDSKNGIELNRVNLDWQFGIRFMFNHFFLGAAYRLPLVPLYNKNSAKMSFSQADITLGFTF